MDKSKERIKEEKKLAKLQKDMDQTIKKARIVYDRASKKNEKMVEKIRDR